MLFASVDERKLMSRNIAKSWSEEVRLKSDALTNHHQRKVSGRVQGF
jgi:hypothetical protein